MSKKHEHCQTIQGPLGALISGSGNIVHGFWEFPCHECTVNANAKEGISLDEHESWEKAAILEELKQETEDES